MAYRNTFFRWLFLYSLTFGLTYVLKLFTYLCPETGHTGTSRQEFRNGIPVYFRTMTAAPNWLWAPADRIRTGTVI